jgi:transcriptional regulator with XRE-family HTH domain
MNVQEIAQSLRARQEARGFSVQEVARLACCSLGDATRVLAGDPEVPLGTLLQVADALEHVAVVVPRPLAPVIEAGTEVTEPAVETVVSAALRQLRFSTTLPSRQRGPAQVLSGDVQNAVRRKGDTPA